MKSMTTQPIHRNANLTESISAKALNGLDLSHPTNTFFQHDLPLFWLPDNQDKGLYE